MADDLQNFGREFLSLCQAKSQKAMIVYDQGNGIRQYTYKDVVAYCAKYHAFFADQGLKQGDTVVAIMPNSPEAIICFLAAAVRGIHYAPVPCTVSAREYRNWLELVKPSLVIKKDGIADYEADIPSFDCGCDGSMSWLDEYTGSLKTVNEADANIYLLTSGTTGTPKAMSISVNRLWGSGKAFVGHYGIENSEYRFWNYLPMSYLGGLFNLCLIPLCCGGSFVISEPFSGKTFLNFWDYAGRHDITALWFVPSIVDGLLKIFKLVNGKNLQKYGEKIKIAFLGTAPIPLKKKQEFENATGIRMYENFALSETTFLVAETENDIRFREQGSVGKPLPYVQVRLVPINDMEETKTIWVKTPYLFNGYMFKDRVVVPELDKDGYFNTHDIGRINDDGVVVLEGRDRDIIKKGGLFVSLAEIESLVAALPEVDEAVAVPVPHDFYGESYDLYVSFKEKEKTDEQKNRLFIWLTRNIVPYKMPNKIYIRDEFPRTASGKIQKGKLKLYEEGWLNAQCGKTSTAKN